MSGIYIHIPFCKQACYYCDFHFSTSLAHKSELINAIIKEIEIQKNYFGNEKVETIYFGGGTPSILLESEINLIIDKLNKCFKIENNAEISLEANPDDLNSNKLRQLKNATINRLSIGIQTFDDTILKYLNRVHSGEEALNSVRVAQEYGFENLNLDLIYGSELTTNKVLENDLETFKSLNIQHISAYNLTIENKTVFGNYLKRGKISPINDSKSAEQYILIEEYLKNIGFEHYEISNYALPYYYSKHNKSYWEQKKYLGIGPSAHSFNGTERHFTVKNNANYIKSINDGIIPSETEILSRENKINEYLMTGLRTIWGCDLNHLLTLDYDLENLKYNVLNEYLSKSYITIENKKLILTNKGRLFTDSIVLELMV